MSHRRAHRVRVAVLATLALTSLAACRRKPTPQAVPSGPTADELASRDAEEAARRAREDSLANARREQEERDALARSQRGREEATGGLRATLLAPVFFDYDQSALRDDSRRQLESKLPILTANPDLRIRIGGHTDERGSDEYNLALGQRRASAVKAFLTGRGVEASRVDIVSFGKERPTCGESDDTCYGQNRRAEFEITGGGATLAAPRP
jgi:peptidoglycan-associated lipoprotein